MPSRIALLILLSTVLAFAIWPTPAGAGTYDVHSLQAAIRARLDTGREWHGLAVRHDLAVPDDGLTA